MEPAPQLALTNRSRLLLGAVDPTRCRGGDGEGSSWPVSPVRCVHQVVGSWKKTGCAAHAGCTGNFDPERTCAGEGA